MFKDSMNFSLKSTFQHLVVCILIIQSAALCSSDQQVPEFVKKFFKRFTAEMGYSKIWTLTTKKITTDWGNCILNDNEIIVTIGEETFTWQVPDGPWTVKYYTEEDRLEIVPQSFATASYLPAIQKPEISLVRELTRQSTNKNSRSFEEMQRVQQGLAKNVAHKFSLLTIDEAEIDKIITAVDYYIKTYELDKQVIWKNINEQIAQKIMYHQSQLGHDRKLKDLALWLASAGSISVALGFSTYLIYQKWHKVLKQDYNNIVQDLKKINVTVGYHIYVPWGLTSEQSIYVSNCRQSLIKIDEKMEGVIFAEIAGGIGTFLVSALTILGVNEWLNPQHEKHIAKLALVHDKIAQHHLL